jgi:hypothetical protein
MKSKFQSKRADRIFPQESKREVPSLKRKTLRGGPETLSPFRSRRGVLVCWCEDDGRKELFWR